MQPDTPSGLKVCSQVIGKRILDAVNPAETQKLEPISQAPSRAHKCKSRNLCLGFSEKTGGNLLSRKLYNHYHRQDCV